MSPTGMKRATSRLAKRAASSEVVYEVLDTDRHGHPLCEADFAQLEGCSFLTSSFPKWVLVLC